MKELQWILVVIGAGLGFLYGDLNGFFMCLLAFTVIDYITGVAAAIKKRELNSRVGAIGIVKKVVIFAMVSVSHLIDAYIIGNGSTFQTAVTLYYIANEGISICENASVYVPLPKKLTKFLEQLKDENGKE